MAEQAEYSKQTIISIRNNLRQFESYYAPQIQVGRKRIISSLIIEALCKYLYKKPELYLKKMAVFLWDKFQAMVTIFSIRRALIVKVCSKKRHVCVLKNKIPICGIIRWADSVCGPTWNAVGWPFEFVDHVGPLHSALIGMLVVQAWPGSFPDIASLFGLGRVFQTSKGSQSRGEII